MNLCEGWNCSSTKVYAKLSEIFWNTEKLDERGLRKYNYTNYSIGLVNVSELQNLWNKPSNYAIYKVLTVPRIEE